MHSSFQAKVATAFGAAVFVVGFLTTVSWNFAQDAVESAELVSNTQEALKRLAQIRADTLQIEFTTQSYRISGERGLIEERDRTIAAREEAMNRVRELLHADTQQMARWRLLRQVVDERVAIAKKIENLRSTQGSDVASAYVATAPLRETRERLYGLLRELDKDAETALTRSIAARLESHRVVTAAGGSVAILLIVLLLSMYSLIRRQLRDIERSQFALAKSEASLATTVRSLGDAVLETDAAGRVVRMNPVAERLTGWSQGQAAGRWVGEVFSILDEESHQPSQDPVGRVLQTGEIQGLDNDSVLVRRDGTKCPVGDSAAPIRGIDGALLGVVLVFRDVSTERQAKRLMREQNALLERHVLERTRQLEETQDHLRAVMNSAPVMIAYVDADQRYVYVNDQYLARFTPQPSSVVGRAVLEILGEEMYSNARPHIEAALRGAAVHFDHQPAVGIWKSIEYVPKRDVQGAVIGYYVMVADITERKLAEEKIVDLNAELLHRVNELERVSRALKTLSAGNSTMLRATDEDQLLRTMCQAIVDAGGYPIAMVWYRMDDEACSTRVMAESGYPGGLDRLRQLKSSWADGPYGRGAIALAIRTGNTQVVGNMLTDPAYVPWQDYLIGNASCIACPINVNGSVIGTLTIYAKEPNAFGEDEIRLLTASAEDLAFGIASLRARAAQAQSEMEAFRLTHIDVLTGLANGTLFMELLAEAIAHGAQTRQPFALIQSNIERLTEINDALGFSQGDELLREFGERLRAVVPDDAVVARLRGDEFAVMLRTSNQATAESVVQRIEGMLNRPFPLGDILIDVSCKTGVALFPSHGTSTHDLLRHVDMAVRQARKSDQAFAVYDPSADSGRPQRLNMAGSLRRAIEGGDLLLHLQPKVDMSNGRVLGAEALVRWKHSDHGLIPPIQFIELAEHTGLIKPLTEWVIDTAMRLVRSWHCEGIDFPIAVNLSAKNLRDEGLVSRIRRLQAELCLPRGLLEFEITETALMDDAKLAMRVLRNLKDEGISLYIDDFGTGYSSLSYLQKLPVDYIKIDQSFVRGMALDNDSALIVRSTIELAHDLGRKAVAEGVETSQDWDLLARLGCDVAQGYFIAKPMPSELFLGWAEDYAMSAWIGNPS